jgi:hypothetical protein
MKGYALVGVVLWAENRLIAANEQSQYLMTGAVLVHDANTCKVGRQQAGPELVKRSSAEFGEDSPKAPPKNVSERIFLGSRGRVEPKPMQPDFKKFEDRGGRPGKVK